MQRILIYSSAFHPAIGGLEFVARTVAELLCGYGYHVTVVTKTPSLETYRYPFLVVRNPSPLALLRIYRESALVLHMNVSLRALWPFIFFRRSLVIVHNGFYRRVSGHLGMRDRVKLSISRFTTNVACSEAVGRDLPARCVVIRNPYDSDTFKSTGSKSRPLDLVFVGRLVSEKGIDLLLRSVLMLKHHGLTPTLTIVGSGPELEPLRQFCIKEGIQNQVSFSGTVAGDELAAVLNQHKIMVVPSRSEGFGVVALEGIASGCIVIGSDAGGLPEAIGECGLVFRNGDVEDLTRALARAMSDHSLATNIAGPRTAHLARFSRREVGSQYLKVIDDALARAVSR